MNTDKIKSAWRKVKQYAEDNPKTVAVGAMLLLAFSLGVYARGAIAASFKVECGPGVSGVYDPVSATITCVKDGATLPPVITPPPVPVPADPFAGCPAGALKIDGQWGQTAIETRNFGNFGGQVMSIRVAPPASWSSTSVKTSSWVEFIDGQNVREAVFSTVPCDFGNANALRNGMGQVQSTVGQGRIDFSFKYKSGTAAQFAVGLAPGKVYFINVRNVGCSATCNMRGGLPQ